MKHKKRKKLEKRRTKIKHKTDEELTDKELNEKYTFVKVVWETGTGYPSKSLLCPF